MSYQRTHITSARGNHCINDLDVMSREERIPSNIAVTKISTLMLRFVKLMNFIGKTRLITLDTIILASKKLSYFGLPPKLKVKLATLKMSYFN